jgi:hypothetical protein
MVLAANGVVKGEYVTVKWFYFAWLKFHKLYCFIFHDGLNAQKNTFQFFNEVIPLNSVFIFMINKFHV